jgi:mRNA-degrading endonuclease RelE of RelBE toxin-antitoxin system
MSFDFVLTTKAREDLEKLDGTTRKRIAKKLQILSGYDDLTHVAIGLEGEMQGMQKIRIGHYRVICIVGGTVVTIVRVRHRRNAYR